MQQVETYNTVIYKKILLGRKRAQKGQKKGTHGQIKGHSWAAHGLTVVRLKILVLVCKTNGQVCTDIYMQGQTQLQQEK
jgi:hypothetical protein